MASMLSRMGTTPRFEMLRANSLTDAYSLELMLNSDAHNVSRLQFLDKLGGKPWERLATNEERVAAVHREAQPWVVAKREEVLKTLRKPAVDECPVLLKAVHENGGITFLKDM